MMLGMTASDIKKPCILPHSMAFKNPNVKAHFPDKIVQGALHAYGFTCDIKNILVGNSLSNHPLLYGLHVD